MKKYKLLNFIITEDKKNNKLGDRSCNHTGRCDSCCYRVLNPISEESCLIRILRTEFGKKVSKEERKSYKFSEDTSDNALSFYIRDNASPMSYKQEEMDT